MQQPLQITTDDGFQTEIAEQPDGTLRVIVSGMMGRQWQATRATIEEAIGVAYQIRTEQAGVSVPAEQQPETSEGTDCAPCAPVGPSPR